MAKYPGDYDKASEPHELRGGWAAPRWWTGKVLGVTSKFDKPRYICVQTDDRELLLVERVKGDYDVAASVRASFYGQHVKNDAWSPFGSGIIIRDMTREPIHLGDPPAPPPALSEPPGDEEFIRLTELAEHWNIPERTLRSRVEAGALPAIKKGKTWFVERSKLKL